jgi:foldase protein PrsA
VKRLLLLLLVGALGLLVAGCDAITPYAAKVNKGTIGQRALESELEAILDNRTYLDSLQQGQVRVQGSAQNAFDSTFVARILTRQIFLELVHQEVKRRKIELTPAELTQAEADVAATFQDPKILEGFPKGYRALLARRTAEVTALQAALAKVDLSEATVKKFYDEHQADFRETCVEHILFDNKPAADAARAKIAAGQDFATIAKTESKDTGSGAQGGSLGCVAPGNFVPEFETAMNALKPGELSQPIESQFGFHLIRVKSRQVLPLKDATDQIRQQLLGSGQNEFNAFLGETLDTAKIEVNPRYGKFVKAGQQPGVVPPDAPGPAQRNVPTTLPGGEIGGEPGEEPAAVPGG